MIEENEDVLAITSNNNQLCCVGVLSFSEPGVLEFFIYLEHRHYVPGTKKGDGYRMKVVCLNDVLWGILGVPLEDEKLIRKSVNFCGLSIVDNHSSVLPKRANLICVAQKNT